MSWYDEHGIHYTEQRFRPVSRFYGDAGAYTDAGARENREPKDPPRSAERIDWWDQLERLVGDRLSDDQRALAEYLKAAGHTLRQTHSLLVTSQMDQLVYRMWDGIPPWVFCRVLGMSKSGMQVILVKSIVLVDPRDVM